MSYEQKLKGIQEHFAELGRLLSDPETVASGDFAKVSKEYSDLEPLVELINELFAAQTEASELETMLKDPECDPEMLELAGVELEELKKKIPELEHAIKVKLLPKDEADEKNAIFEVRAGTGGDEAALFAGELFRMYQRYADLHNWKFEVLSVSDTEIGGMKEGQAVISGSSVFALLKFEAGVHRVQRVPQTETGGRIHTSAATVAVLPEAEEVDIQIEDKDIRIDVFRASGPGGQSVNTTDSAVRITHLPTGIIVQQQDEKSQHRNKAKAMKVMRSRLYERERAEREAERSASRLGQVGSGDRSERIRTYNFPQGRVTDHRINLTLYKLDKVLTGEGLDEFIEALIADEQAQLLSQLD